MVEGKLLRFAAPALYQRMVETFSTYHIHPYDVQATIFKKEDGFDVILMFSNDFSQSVSTFLHNEQVDLPDEDVTRFFEEAADKCKSTLIADYFKMIKL